MDKVDKVADAYGVSNGKAKKIIRQKAKKHGKHSYVPPKRGTPVGGLKKHAKKG